MLLQGQQLLVIGTALGMDLFQLGQIVKQSNLLCGQSLEGDLGGVIGIERALEGQVIPDLTVRQLLPHCFIMRHGHTGAPQIQTGQFLVVNRILHENMASLIPYIISHHAANRQYQHQQHQHQSRNDPFIHCFSLIYHVL